jgi:hypothetical protein
MSGDLLVQGIFLGVFATQVMDASGLIGRATRLTGLPRPSLLGRWVLYLARGRLRHKDIRETPKIRFEFVAGLMAHYSIGVALGTLYVLLSSLAATGADGYLLPMAYGLATCGFAWFVLYPAYGFGYFGRQGPAYMKPLRTSTWTHLFYGVGAGLWLNIFSTIVG